MYHHLGNGYSSLSKKNPAGDFNDKIILIMGGTTGIGLAAAVLFCQQGAKKVVVCGRTVEKWQQSQKTLSLACRKIIEYIQCDIRIEMEVKHLIQKIFDVYGAIDVCFNNAGVSPSGNYSIDGDITKTEFHSYKDTHGTIHYSLGNNHCPISQQSRISSSCESPLATNIIGMFYCLKWELHFIYQRQPKNRPVSIINTSSVQGSDPIVPIENPLYAASKAFIDNLTISIATQAARYCIANHRAMIRVNAIAPGPTDTPLERAMYYKQGIVKAALRTAIKKVATPTQIAYLVLFLANNHQSENITGSILPIDGGPQ